MNVKTTITAAVLAAASAAACAVPIAAAPNPVGGAVILTNDPCPQSSGISAERRKNSWYVYSTIPTGVSLKGCYYVDTLSVHVFWYSHAIDEPYRIFPADSFKSLAKGSAV